MPVIHKPGLDVFRDSRALVAARVAKTVAKESGRGVFVGLGSLYLTFALFFVMSASVTMLISGGTWTSIFALPVIAASVLAFHWIWRAPRRERAIADGAMPTTNDISVPLPDYLCDALREETRGNGFHVTYWPRAFAKQAGLTLFYGVLLICFMGWLSVSSPAVVARLSLIDFLGFLVVAGFLTGRGSCLLALGFRNGGICVSATLDRLVVRSLWGTKHILWREVADIRIDAKRDGGGWTFVAAPSANRIVVTGRPGSGTARLKIPYMMLGLDRAGAEQLRQRLLEMRSNARRLVRSDSHSAAHGSDPSPLLT